MHVALAGPASPESLRDLLDVSRTTELPVGLGGTPVNALARALVVAGHQVTLVTLSPDVVGETVHAGECLSLVVQPWRPRARDRARDFFKVERRSLLAGIRSAGADIVHAHWTYEYAWAAIASGRSSLITVHDAPVTILRYHRDAYRLVRLAMAVRVRAGAGLLSAVSPYAAACWRREMADRRSVHVIPNIAPAFSVERSLPEDLRHVVMIGTPERRKNIRAGLDAFALARASDHRLRLRVIGPGLDPFSPIAAAIEDPDKCGIDFLGELSADAVHQELARACLMLHPSLEETQGMVLLEAMRAGVPIIAGASSGGVPWTLDGGAAGMLVDVSDARAMGEAVAYMVAHPEVSRRYVREGQRLLDGRFSAKLIVDSYVSLYEQLQARPSS